LAHFSSIFYRIFLTYLIQALQINPAISVFHSKTTIAPKIVQNFLPKPQIFKNSLQKAFEKFSTKSNLYMIDVFAVLTCSLEFLDLFLI